MRATMVAVVALCSVISVSAQDSLEVRELKAAVAMLQKQAAATTIKIEKAELQRKELARSLAEAVRVSEEQAMAAREAQLKLEAFGVDLFTKDENSLEQRLLKAVRDLDIAHQEQEAQSRAIADLVKAFSKYIESTKELAPDAAKLEADEAIAFARKAQSLGPDGGKKADETNSGLDNSKVVSIDSEIGLLVLNSGRSDGIRVGTPIAVLRGEQPIYTAMVVDVRESICGAVLQDKIGDVEGVRVGDIARLLPNEGGTGG